MSVLNRLASSLRRRDEVPNQELARDLASNRDKAGIREIAENLRNKDKNIQADCIKVLYEIGHLEPELIADYTEDFAKCLKSKNNRLVWDDCSCRSGQSTSCCSLQIRGANQKSQRDGLCYHS
jgi:hypothetical protein